MKFNKKDILAIVIICIILSCKNSTEKVKTGKNTDENPSTSTDSSKQIDRKGFHKSLPWKNFNFDISTTGEGSIQQLEIQPYGLKNDNKKITEEIEGSVTNAEIEDLNSDGFPEILIYTTSAGSGSYGNVIGYSVNNGKSLSKIYFPPVSDNSKANMGYMGHDEFNIVEKILTQTFKTYKVDDKNSNPTGNIRQIQYKLKDGESSRKFVVDNIKEYPVQ